MPKLPFTMYPTEDAENITMETSQASVREVLRKLPLKQAYQVLSGAEVASVFGQLVVDSAADVRQAVAGLAVTSVKIAYGESQSGASDGTCTAWLYQYLTGFIPVAEQFSGLLHDSKPAVRRTTAQAYGALAFALNEGEVRGPDYAQMRDGLRRALLATLPSLTALLADDDTEVRSATLQALGQFKFALDSEVLPHLRAALSDRDARIRLAAAKAMNDCLGAHAQADLAPLVEDRDDEMLDFVVEQLAKYGNPACVPVLLERLASMPTRAVVSQIQRVGVPQALPLLTRLLSTCTDNDILREAASALIEIGEQSAIPALVKHVTHENRLVGVAVILALGRLRSHEAAPHLAKLLHPDSTVQDWRQGIAALCLGRIGDEKHGETLLRAFQFPNAKIQRDQLTQRYLLDALAMLKYRNALPLVRERVSSSPYGTLLLALGQLGDATDIHLLEPLRESGDGWLGSFAALAMALLDPNRFDAPAAKLLAVSPQKQKRIETWEDQYLAMGYAWRALASRASSSGVAAATRQLIKETGLAWVQSFMAAMPAARDCFHGRGAFSSASMGLVLIVEDSVREAEQGLRSLP